MTTAVSELSILVADDDTEFMNSVVRVLNHAIPGMRLFKAQNGNTAFEIITGAKPMLAILDGYMQPGPTGPEIVRFLKSERSDIRTRCLVTSGDHLLTARARELGADVLPKPYDVEHLKAYVCSVVERAKLYGNGNGKHAE